MATTITLTGRLADLTSQPIDPTTTTVTVKAPAYAPGPGVELTTTQPATAPVGADGEITINTVEGVGWLTIDGPGWSDSIRFVAAAGMTTVWEAVVNALPHVVEIKNLLNALYEAYAASEAGQALPPYLMQTALDAKYATKQEFLAALQAKVEPLVADYIGDDRVIQDAAAAAVRDQIGTQGTASVGFGANARKNLALDAEGKIQVVTAQVLREQDATSKGYVDAQNAFKNPIRLTSGSIDTLRNAADANEYVVASAAAAQKITGWPIGQPGYLINRTAGVPTQMVITYTANGPRIFWREWRPGPSTWSEWVEQGAAGQQSEVALEHAVREDAARKRHGYVLPTNGRGVVMLRFDDYPQDFINKVLPLLRKYDLPAYWACTIRHVEQEQPTEWGTVQDWFLKDGIRIWNHSKTHSNSTNPSDILDNIVGAADYFESEMPHVAIDGWVAPGTGTSTPYNDFVSGQPASYWSTYAGRLIMQRHGIVNGGAGGYMQPMGGNAVAQSHYTFEKSTVAQFKAQVQIAQRGPYALSMMAHPQNLGATGYMSLADFESCLAWLAAERDSGRLMVLTGDVAPVLSPGGGTRNDLAPNFPTGSLATVKTYSIDTAPTYWAGGGTREFEVTVTADAESVISLEVTGTPAKTRQFTIPAGVSTVRTFFGMPKGFTTVGLTARRVSGGAVTLNAAHLYAA